MPRFSFDSIEEIQEFVKRLKGTRGGKDKDEAETGNAPAPLQPPAGGGPAQSFNPGAMQGFAAPAAGAVAGAFPAAGAQIDPAVQALVTRIVTRLDTAIASGQKADEALGWLKSQCGPEASGYTLDQIKQHALPKLALPVLENMAKLMAA